MTDLSRDARAILEAGRDLDGPGELERTRVRRALLARTAAGAGTALAASSAAAGGAAAGSSATLTATLAKVLVPLAIVMAGGVGATVAWRAHREARPVPLSPAAAPAALVAPTPATMSEPIPAQRPALPPRRAHIAAPAHVAPPANRLAEETALLAAANAQLRAGDARRALTLLRDYDRRYPSGVLREEVLATRVIARCQIGPGPNTASRRAADVFLTRYPASPLAPRVRSSCAR